MRLWIVFALGALYGLAMRLLFGMPMFNSPGTAGGAGPMMASFVVLVPVLVGVFTVHAARRRPPSLLFAVFGPWIPTTCFAAGCVIAMALPIFWIVSSAGGVLCWVVLKFVDVPQGGVNGLLLLPSTS